jgi:hypothetical protein
VGRAAFAFRPVHARLLDQLKQSTKLFADARPSSARYEGGISIIALPIRGRGNREATP